MTLYLFDTDFKFLEGDGPSRIDLNGLKVGEVLTFGRGSGTCPVSVTLFARKNGSEIISRKHAEVRKTSKDGYEIRDLQSINGTFVNGRRIAIQILSDGDIVQFGGVANARPGEEIGRSAHAIKYNFKVSSSVPAAAVAGHKRRKNENNHNHTANNHQADVAVAASGITGTTSINNGNTRTSRAVDQYEDDSRKKKAACSQTITTNATTTATADHLDKDRESISGRTSNINAEAAAMTIGALMTEIDLLRRELKNSRQIDDGKKKMMVGNDIGTSSSSTAATAATMTSVAIKKEPGATGSSSAKEGCSINIDVSSLNSITCCALCSLSLVDAVVLPCSHGFCWACLETHFHNKNGDCPSCEHDTAPSIAAASVAVTGMGEAATGGGGGGGGKARRANKKYAPHTHAPYYRSEHLDSVVWLMLEASSSGSRDQFIEREKQNHGILRSFGIDPHSNPGLNYFLHQQQQQQQQGGAEEGKRRRTDSSDGQHTSGRQNRDDSKSDVPQLFCDYCGEDGHTHGDCPHDDSRKSNEEEEDSGDSDDDVDPELLEEEGEGDDCEVEEDEESDL